MELGQVTIDLVEALYRHHSSAFLCGDDADTSSTAMERARAVPRETSAEICARLKGLQTLRSLPPGVASGNATRRAPSWAYGAPVATATGAPCAAACCDTEFGLPAAP